MTSWINKHIYTVILVIEIILGGLFFVTFGPLLHNFYWTMYVYECFGYSIRLGILKWIICLFYAISFYNLFNYVDGAVVGLVAVIFFVFYARFMLWMKRKFGFIPIVLCNTGLNIGIIVAIVIRLLRFRKE